MTGELPVERRLPLTARLDPAHPAYSLVLEAHEAALSADVATYRDPLSGLEVLTAAELWTRGFCCNSGCRHCPFSEGPRGPARHTPAPRGDRP